MIEKIKYFLQQFLFKKHFVFRSQYYFETAVVSDTNVIEYEFINVGRTSVFVNDAELLPVQLGVPVGSGIGDIFSRMKLSVNYNEEDTTIYRIKFPIQNLTIKTCEGSNCFPFFVPCLIAPICSSYTIDVFVGNGFLNLVPIVTPFVITCTMSAITIQNLFIANLLPQFAGASVVVTSFSLATGLCITISDLQVGLSVTTLYISFNPVLIACPVPDTQPFALTCVVPIFLQPKLLVITKVKAGLKDNP
jgi:hypothetical protein